MAPVIKKAVAAVVTLVALLAMAGTWYLKGHGFRRDQFGMLRRGMTAVEVQAAIGQPGVRHGGFWIYGSHLKLCRGIVLFDANGRVADIFHDH
jgi:hypothetical protein